MVDVPTRDTLLEQARKGSRQAVAELCDHYRDAVEAYIRCLGHADAEDLTQGFFTYVIEVDFFRTADAKRSQFRRYLRGAVRKYIAKQRRDAARLKRGGGHDPVPLEDDLLHEDTTPEDVYRQHWAQAILQQARQRMIAQYDDDGEGKRGRLLIRFARRNPEPGEYEAIAKQLGYDSTSPVSSAVARMRERYEQLVRVVLSECIPAAEFDEEFDALELAWDGGDDPA